MYFAMIFHLCFSMPEKKFKKLERLVKLNMCRGSSVFTITLQKWLSGSFLDHTSVLKGGLPVMVSVHQYKIGSVFDI